MRFLIDRKFLCLLSLILIAISIIAESDYNIASVCFITGLFLLLLSSLFWGLVVWEKAISRFKFNSRIVLFLIILISEGCLVVLACFSDLWLMALSWNYLIILVLFSLVILRNGVKHWCLSKLVLTWIPILFFLIFSLMPWSRLVLSEHLSQKNYIEFLLRKAEVNHMPGHYQVEFHKFEYSCNGTNASVYVVDSFFIGSFLFICSQGNEIIKVQRMPYL